MTVILFVIIGLVLGIIALVAFSMSGRKGD